ncbi:M48 family metallopeptidase [Aliikangiella sp. G2MR2-5]|uniref:tetratricopeptide repeat protein n=1 Tax=Aliikangiella sp. G2MR2-5 TaxID=2788943 RepID=UPI0018AA7C4F|nr:tetratricopeptide repeat protein [Aliikangiella sp. G2MR2-5]
MAIRFGSFVLTVIVAVLLLSACKTTVVKDQPLSSSGVNTTKISSSEFLPYLKVNPLNGEKLAYKPVKNPYLVEKGPLSHKVVNLFIQARNLIRTGQLDDAVKVLQELTKETDELSGPYLLLGDIAKKKNKLDVAIKYYKQAVAINKSNVNAYIKLALVLKESGQFESARAALIDALVIWPDFPEAHFNLSVLLDNYLNETELAQKHMEAYQLLATSLPAQIDGWLANLRQRTQKMSYLEVDFKEKQQVVLARLEEERKAQLESVKQTEASK